MNQIGGSAFGFGFSGPEFLSSFIERDWARSDAERAQVHSAQQAQKQMDFQERMSNTQWQRGVADMQSAGLNPMLAYSQGGASSPQGAAFPGIQPHRTGFTSIGSQGNVQLRGVTAAQVALMDAQADRERAEADRVRTTTPLTAKKLEVEARHFEEDIGRILQDIATGSASAESHRATAEKFRAEIPVLVNQAKSLFELAKKYAQDTKVGTQEEIKLKQFISSNLPDIERQLKQLELIIKRYGEPAARLDREAAEGIMGSVNRFMRMWRGRLSGE